MSLIALTSAAGAPGVTTSTLAFALTWPRPSLLVEADVTGGSSILAGYLRGQTPHDHGMVDLALAYRRGDLVGALREVVTPLGERTNLVAGIRTPAQAPSLAPLWDPLAAALKGLDRTGTDALVDAGRLGAVGGPIPLLRKADLVLLVTRTTLPALSATRVWAKELRADLAAEGTGDDALRLLLVGEGHPYTRGEIQAAVDVPVLAALAWDPVSAEVLSLGSARGRKFDTAPLMRSVTSGAGALDAAITRRTARLAPLAATGGDRP